MAYSLKFMVHSVLKVRVYTNKQKYIYIYIHIICICIDTCICIYIHIHGPWTLRDQLLPQRGFGESGGSEAAPKSGEVRSQDANFPGPSKSGLLLRKLNYSCSKTILFAICPYIPVMVI